MPGRWVNGVYYADAANAPGGRYNPGRVNQELDGTPIPYPPAPQSPAPRPMGAPAMAPRLGDNQVPPFMLGLKNVRTPMYKGTDDEFMPADLPGSPLGGMMPAGLPPVEGPDAFSGQGPGVVEGEGLPPEVAPKKSWSWSGMPPTEAELASQRARFLSTGASPEIGMMADAARGRELVAENISRNRPDLYEAGLRRATLETAQGKTPEGMAAERSRIRAENDTDLAVNGLRRARLGAQMKVEEGMAPLLLWQRPEAKQQRQDLFGENLNFLTDPRAVAQAELEHKREMEKVEANTWGRIYGGTMGGAMMGADNPLYNLFGRQPGGAGGPGPGGEPEGAGAPPEGGGQTITQAQLTAYAKANGLMYDQALAQAQSEGLTVVK